MGLKVGKIFKSAVKAGVGTIIGGPAGFAAGASGDSTVGGLTGWDAVSGAVGLGQDAAAAEMDLYYQKKAADYAYKQNLAFWNMQNAYNDPAAQMARLKAAGLNPNLVYGGGNVTGNTSSGGPEYSLQGSYKDRSVERQQLQLAMREHNQRITNQAIENDLARQRLVLAERDADRSDALAQAQIKAMQANIGVYDANINNMAFQHDYNNRQLAWQRYKHDVDAYDKAAKEYDSKYSLGFSKFGANFKVSGQAKRNVVKHLGFRPKYSDYLHGYK